MSLEDNKELVRRYIMEFWNDGDDSILEELVAPDVYDHQPLGDEQPGVEGQRLQNRAYHESFDIDMTLEHLVAEGDIVVDHWTGRLTHKGDFLGIPPTGVTINVSALDMHRIVDGKIAETWHLEDFPMKIDELRAAAAAQAEGVISTPDAPAPAGAYSQARRAGAFVFVAGQVPRLPDGTRLNDEPFEVQVRQTLDNLVAVITAAGGSLDDAVKVNVYLRDAGNLQAFDAIYREYVGSVAPARTTVQSDLPGPAVEVDAILHLPSA